MQRVMGGMWAKAWQTLLGLYKARLWLSRTLGACDPVRMARITFELTAPSDYFRLCSLAHCPAP